MMYRYKYQYQVKSGAGSQFPQMQVLNCCDSQSRFPRRAPVPVPAREGDKPNLTIDHNVIY